MLDVLQTAVTYMLRFVGGLALLVLLAWLGLVAIGTFGYLMQLIGVF